MKDLTRRGFIWLCACAMLGGCSYRAEPAASGPSLSSASPSAEGASNSVAQAESELRLVTGGQSGTYYAFGQSIAQHANESAGLAVTALISDGAKANVESVEDGMAEFGFCQSDIMACAYEGKGLYEGAPLGSFSAVAALYDEMVQVVTCDPEIETIADLKGKRVSVGTPESGTYFSAIDVLGAYGVFEQDITPTYQSFGDACESLKLGQIDAAFIVAGTPTKAVSELFSSKKAYLVTIDAQHVAALVSQSPYYLESSVAAETYRGLDENVATVAVSAVIIASDYVPDDDVHAFVKGLFDSASDEGSAQEFAQYGELSVEKGASISTVPYHPGAARFFEEAGFPVTAKQHEE